MWKWKNYETIFLLSRCLFANFLPYKFTAKILLLLSTKAFHRLHARVQGMQIFQNWQRINEPHAYKVITRERVEKANDNGDVSFVTFSTRHHKSLSRSLGKNEIIKQKMRAIKRIYAWWQKLLYRIKKKSFSFLLWWPAINSICNAMMDHHKT